MRALNNVACADSYTSAATIEELWSGRAVVFLVANNSAYMQLQRSTQVGAGGAEWSNEFLVNPSTGAFQGAIGIRFRNAVAGNVARVIAQKPRVLFIAGNAGKEYRYLKNHLTRDTTLSVSCWLQSADAAFNQEGDAPLTTLPKTEQELFGYDVIVMLDPDPREFDAAWAKLLARFVGDHGGGLAFIASNKFTTDFLTAGRGPVAGADRARATHRGRSAQPREPAGLAVAGDSGGI